MKIHRILPMRRPFAQAFTLIELLVVIAIIALLAALSIGAFSMAMQTASRNRTTATMQAIVGALERYKEANGEYPLQADASPSHSTTYTSTAETLYQAVTGDGNNQIKLASGNSTASTGKVADDDKKYIINGDFIPAQNPPGSGTWKSKLNATMVSSDQKFYLIDGFGHPFQYERAAATGLPATTINPTYDLWSYGNSNSTDPTDGSISTKGDAKLTSVWIKNW